MKEISKNMFLVKSEISYKLNWTKNVKLKKNNNQFLKRLMSKENPIHCNFNSYYIILLVSL